MSRFHCISFKPPLIVPTAPKDWHYYALNKFTPEVSDDLSTGLSLEDDDEDADTNTDGQQQDSSTAASNSTMTLVDIITPLQPATAHPVMLSKTDTTSNNLPSPSSPPLSKSSLPKTDTTGNNIPSPDLLPPNDSLPALVTEVSMHSVPANQDQGVQVTGAPTSPDCNMPRSDIPSMTTDVLPMNVTESQWMKAKKTLTYLREVCEMGKLSDLSSPY